MILEIDERTIGLKHERTLLKICDLAYSLLPQTKFEEAEKLSQQALSKSSELSPGVAYAIIHIKACLGRTRLRQKDENGAEAMFRDAMTLQEKASISGALIRQSQWQGLRWS